MAIMTDNAADVMLSTDRLYELPDKGLTGTGEGRWGDSKIGARAYVPRRTPL